MSPFFFGSSAQALYGVYHQPNKQAERDEAILLCPSFGQEYMRSHRANRQLAASLAKSGFHVLRFDYRGTGDSSGYIEDVTISDWLEDIETAIEELKETACTKNIHVIGLRLGGLLASTVSMNKKLKIKKLVLWDPIISGKAYDAELQEEMKKENGSKCIGAIDRINHSVLFVDGSTFTRSRMCSNKSAGDLVFQRCFGKKITGQLSFDKFVVGDVLVEEFDHLVSVGPHLSVVVQM